MQCLTFGCRAQPPHESECGFHGSDSSHLGLRNYPLPADGCGYYFQQGYVYTLATLAVIGTFYGTFFLIFNATAINPSAFVVLIAFATFVFQPIRRWIQETLDRWVFYRDRYDARLTMIEFARELSSETDRRRAFGESLRTAFAHALDPTSRIFLVR